MKNFNFSSNIENSSSIESQETHKTFLNHFVDLGYIKRESLSLNPSEEDDTVPFVGSSINAFKDYLISGKSPENSFVINQSCIRTHDIINAYDTSHIPFGMPFFHIDGIFCPPGEYDKIVNDVIKLLKEKYGVDNKNLLIKPTVPEKHSELLGPFVKRGIQTEVDYSRFYQWKYGIDNLKGEGITIFIKDKNGEWWDVGNIVLIYKDDKELAIEFGVGREFLEMSLTGSGDPFKNSNMFKVREHSSPLEKKALTYLEVVLNAISIIQQARGRTKKMINKYINAVFFLSQTVGFTREEIKNIAIKYKELFNGDIDVDIFLEKFDSRLEVLKKLESIFVDIIKRDIDDDKAKKNIADYISQNGIRVGELLLQVGKNYDSNSKIYKLCQEI